MKDEIHHLTAEVEQLLMQNDFDGAEYVIRKFVDQKLENCRKKLCKSEREKVVVQGAMRRQYYANDDYVPYADDDREY